MKTKLDLEREAKAEKVIRENNVKELENRLNEAEATLAVLPKDDIRTYNEETKVVRAEISHIKELLADERKAVMGLELASKGQADAITKGFDI